MQRKCRRAVAYIRDPPANRKIANEDGDKRQRAAIEAYAASAGFEIVGEFHDQDAPGADPIAGRPGFAAMVAGLPSNGARTIIVQEPEHLARDLMIQLDGHDSLKERGITVIAASAPAYFLRHSPGYFSHTSGALRSGPSGGATRA